MDALEIKGRILSFIIGISNELAANNDDIVIDVEEYARKYIFRNEYQENKAWYLRAGEAVNASVSLDDVMVKSTFEDDIWEICWKNECLNNVYWDIVRDGVIKGNLSKADKHILYLAEEFVNSVDDYDLGKIW